MPKTRTIVRRVERDARYLATAKIDPDYVFDTPVPETRNAVANEFDPNAESVGDPVGREFVSK